MPTLYDLLGIEPPDVLKGFTQNPIEGESFVAALTDDSAPGSETQFFSMLGQRAIYDRGWLANTLHPPISGWGHFEADQWELYHLAEDRTQLHDLAAEEPERLEHLKGLWFYWAGKLNGLPLDDRTAREQLTKERPQPSAPRDRYVYYPGTAEIPESVAVNLRRRSFTIAAGVEITGDAEGVIFVQGGVGGGHSLFIQDRRLHYVYNWLGDRHQSIESDIEVPAGRHVLTAEFHKTGEDAATGSATGTLTLYIDEQSVGADEIMTQPGFFALTGDGLAVGRDSGSPVTSAYRPPNTFRGGTIEEVVVDVSGDAFVDHEKEVAAWLMRD